MASKGRLEEFSEYRKRMNERILGAGHLGINRFFNLDTAAYNDGALPGKTKGVARISCFHPPALQ